MLEDRSQNIWFGTYDAGVTRYDGLTFKSFTTNEGLRGNYVRSMLEDGSGNVWVKALGGASVFDGSGMKPFFTPDSLGSNALLPALADSSGGLWFITSHGVSRYLDSTWTSFPAAPGGLVSDSVLFLLERPAGTIWFVTDNGTSQYDGRTWTTIPPPPALGGFGVSRGLVDRSGNLWLGMRGDGGQGGIARWDGSWTTFTTADSLGGNNVTFMLEDSRGNVWAATNTSFSIGIGRGVSRYDGSTWRTYTAVSGLGGNQVNAMRADRSGNVWVATYGDYGKGGGVSRYNESGWRTFTTADGLAGDFVNQILEDGSGNLWFAASAGFTGPSGVGVTRFDGSEWKTFTTADGLAGDYVSSMMKDRSGNLWFGTTTSRFENGYGQVDAAGIGVSRFDGSSWSTLTTADGLASNPVSSMMEDHLGRLWFGSYYGDVSRLDSTWTTISNLYLGTRYVRCLAEDHLNRILFGTYNNGIPRLDGDDWQDLSNWSGFGGTGPAQCLLEDRSGVLWVGTRNIAVGLDRIVDSTMTRFGTRHGLGANDVRSILQDRKGNLWFGTFGGGVSRLDQDSTWTTFTPANGLGGTDILSMLEDRSGNLWFGTTTHDVNFANSVVFASGGVTRFDGSTWRSLFTTAELGSNAVAVSSIMEDSTGALWFGTYGGGVSRYIPDRVPPQTIFSRKPPALTSSQSQTAVFAAFGETDGIEFSYRLDSSDSLAWSSWTSATSWFDPDLPDGVHVLEVRGRDLLSNVDPTPAKAIFEVHATPITPLVMAPVFGQPVRGTIAILGTAGGRLFKEYRVDARSSGASSWNSLDVSSSQVTNDTLALWNSSGLADGNYDIRLSVTDSLGLTGIAQTTVIVDNQAPFVDVTQPAKVSAVTGGNVYTTNAEVHIYFPPHAFTEDRLVTVSALADSMVPASLPHGAARMLPGYEIKWGNVDLSRPSRLSLSYAGIAGAGAAPTGPSAASGGVGTIPSGATLTVYWSADGSDWTPMGGTVSADVRSIELAMTHPGRYALFAVTGVIPGVGTLAGLAFSPRVFSPSGTFADRRVGISFTLGKPAPVTVRIYTRSGRLVREVAAGQPMNAGANLVYWDGRDRNGGIAVDGLYLVTVEALGRTERNTLAVVR